MKTPRLTDFDPNAKAHKLSSPLDGMPIIGKPQPVAPANTAPIDENNAQNDTGTVVPVPGYHKTVVPEGKREIKRRHPFDVYKDQLKALNRLALEEKEQGLLGSQSAMVREAIDDYLRKRKAAK
jgi:hypothetical protein